MPLNNEIRAENTTCNGVFLTDNVSELPQTFENLRRG